MANSCCPSCGENKVSTHKLQNGNVGVWCDYCLKGIPNEDFTNLTDDIDSAEILYDIWRSRYIKNKLNSGNFR